EEKAKSPSRSESSIPDCTASLFRDARIESLRIYAVRSTHLVLVTEEAYGQNLGYLGASGGRVGPERAVAVARHDPSPTDRLHIACEPVARRHIVERACILADFPTTSHNDHLRHLGASDRRGRTECAV